MICRKKVLYSAFTLSLAAVVAACSAGEPTATDAGAEDGAAADAGAGVSGDILVDGSSTVFPISEAMAEEFMAENPDTRVTVGVSGSGGGFKKFCAGETDISNASRPIKQEEMDLCAEAGIEYIEVPVAFDGVTVVVNPENDWAECLTSDQLGAMWAPDAEDTITNWNQIDPSYPDQELGLYGPGTDSGTYDYFTDAVTGEEGESRGDYTASEDDNVIVQGVQADSGGLGFFGYAYYEENQDTLTSVAIENADGDCINAGSDVIADGTYNPLARPIFYYVKTESYETKPQVKAFAEYQIDQSNDSLISEVGYIPLPGEIVEKANARLTNTTTGSIYEGGSSVGVKLSEKL